MNQIFKLNNFEFSKHELISYRQLLEELGTVVPRRIINRSQVWQMLNERERIVTMNFTYYLKENNSPEDQISMQGRAGITISKK